MSLISERELETAHPQRRLASLSTRDAADGSLPTIVCYAVAWGSRNSYGEVFVPGAFTEDLATRSANKPMVMGLYHELAIGKWSIAEQDTAGLRLEGQPSDTSDGRDAATLVEDGALTGISVGFFLDEYQYAGPGQRCTFPTPTGEVSYQFDDSTWYVLKARVPEASLVMVPSDDDARVLAVRNAATRALPALADVDQADWDDVAYSMAVLMGGRGAGSFSDLPAGDRRAIYTRLAGAYKRHDKTPPDFTPSPQYDEIEFRNDEREVFHDLYLRKTLASVTAGAQGLSGPLSAGTRQAAQDAVAALEPLTAPEPASPLAAIRAQLDATTRSLTKSQED